MTPMNSCGSPGRLSWPPPAWPHGAGAEGAAQAGSNFLHPSLSPSPQPESELNLRRDGRGLGGESGPPTGRASWTGRARATGPINQPALARRAGAAQPAGLRRPFKASSLWCWSPPAARSRAEDPQAARTRRTGARPRSALAQLKARGALAQSAGLGAGGRAGPDCVRAEGTAPRQGCALRSLLTRAADRGLHRTHAAGGRAEAAGRWRRKAWLGKGGRR